MGKGDRKTTRGKRFMGSYGKTRKRKNRTNFLSRQIKPDTDDLKLGDTIDEPKIKEKTPAKTKAKKPATTKAEKPATKKTSAAKTTSAEKATPAAKTTSAEKKTPAAKSTAAEKKTEEVKEEKPESETAKKTKIEAKADKEAEKPEKK